MAATPDRRDRREEDPRDRGRDRRDDDLRDRDRDRSNKERDKASDREKERRERDRNRDKEKDRRKDDRHKEKAREKERAKDRDRERDKDKDREWEGGREDWDRGRERDREDRQRDKDREKNRDKVSKDDIDGKKRKERTKEPDRDADREPKDRRKEKEKKERDHDKQRGKYSGTGKDLNDGNRNDIEMLDEDKEKPKWSQKRRHDEDVGQEDGDEGRHHEETGAIAVEGQAPSWKERGENVNEIASWVSRSRKLAERKRIEEKVKAARMARMLEEQENRVDEEYEAHGRPSTYGGVELAGLKVKHGLEKLIEGGAVTFTLKDKGILEGENLNEEVDELENVEIAEQKARTEAYKAAKAKPGIHEDKFQNDINAVATVLPTDELEMKDAGITLDDFGSISEESQKRLQDIRSRLQGVSNNMEISLTDKAVNLVSDYFTQEEMIHFNKPKKRKRLRKKETLDINALEAEAIAEGRGAEDLGSRSSGKRQAAKQEEERTAEASRKAAYELAFAKAVDSSRKLREGNVGAKSVVDQEELVFGGEDDDELYNSLHRAREAALKKQRANGLTGTGPQAVITALKQSTPTSQVETIGEQADKEKVILTDTEEFCRSLQLEDATARKPGPKESFVEKDEEVTNMTMEEELEPTVDGGWREVKEADDQRQEEKTNTEEDEDLEEPIKECTLGKGLAGALQLLKERGNLRETVEWGGRNMDKKKSKLVGVVDDSDTKGSFKEIQLDRVDEFGRIMTPKEAFRRLSHKFHGKGPGKMKLEKRVKQYQEEMKLKQMNAGDTPLMSMEKMREAQARMHTPYIVISGAIKPGQTSDHRSGFGTVEKEQIGSLTPMLGDRKVEHFLGIKRKPENKSMGPPPPKKPKAG